MIKRQNDTVEVNPSYIEPSLSLSSVSIYASCWLNYNISGAPGLVDMVFAVHAESRRFDSHRRHMSERFFRSNRPGYPHPVCSELELVATEWRSVIAVSVNVGGGVRLIKPAKLYMCTQTHYKHDEDGRTAPCVRGHGSVPLSRSGNVVTRIGLHTQLRYFLLGK